jgi:hypothetical protein
LEKLLLKAAFLFANPELASELKLKRSRFKNFLKMAAKKDKREELLNFIDKNAFDPILKASPKKYSDKDREKLEDIQRKTQNEKD